MSKQRLVPWNPVNSTCLTTWVAVWVLVLTCLSVSSSFADDGDDVSARPPVKSLRAGVVDPPSKLPGWLEAEPVRKGAVHSEPVKSDYCDSQQAAQRSLKHQIEITSKKYIDWLVGRPGASSYLPYDRNLLAKMVHARDTVADARDFGFGEMHRASTRVEFDVAFRQRVQRDWDQVVANSRVWQLGLGGAGIFVALLMFMGYFKLDTATRGFYTRRLQWLTLGGFAALIGAAVYFGRLLPWL